MNWDILYKMFKTYIQIPWSSVHVDKLDYSSINIANLSSPHYHIMILP